MKTLRRFLLDASGAAAVEMALVFSLIVAPSFLCLWDFAAIYQGKVAVDEALQDAATYTMNSGSNATSAGATSAAQAAGGSSISVSVSTVCYCVSTSSTVATMPVSASCTGSCSGSAVLQQFMKITTANSVSIPLPVSWISLASPYSVTAVGYVRTG